MSYNDTSSYQTSPGACSSDGPNSTPTESDTLLPGKDPRRKPSDVRPILSLLLAVSFLLFMLGNLVVHVWFCPLYPSTMIEVRRGWEKEVADHDLFLKRWDQAKREHIIEEQDWKLQEEWHEREVSRWMEEEEDRQEAVRRAMEHERRQWSLELEEHEKEVARRTHQEQERQARVRKEWAEEYERNAHELEDLRRRENLQREVERQRWEREIAEHDRIEEERRRHEEQERQKLNMFWGHVEAQGCTTYGTREYTATLMNLPATWQHRVEACKATPLEVHGISYFPQSCEDYGPGVVISRWAINQQEPYCTTFWDGYSDKGCTSPGSGKKRIEHKLMDLPAKADWQEFCATTPIHFNGMHFPGAHQCYKTVFGVYGQWEINDTHC